MNILFGYNFSEHKIFCEKKTYPVIFEKMKTKIIEDSVLLQTLSQIRTLQNIQSSSKTIKTRIIYVVNNTVVHNGFEHKTNGRAKKKLKLNFGGISLLFHRRVTVLFSSARWRLAPAQRSHEISIVILYAHI